MVGRERAIFPKTNEWNFKKLVFFVDVSPFSKRQKAGLSLILVSTQVHPVSECFLVIVTLRDFVEFVRVNFLPLKTCSASMSVFGGVGGSVQQYAGWKHLDDGVFVKQKLGQLGQSIIAWLGEVLYSTVSFCRKSI